MHEKLRVVQLDHSQLSQITVLTRVRHWNVSSPHEPFSNACSSSTVQWSLALRLYQLRLLYMYFLSLQCMNNSQYILITKLLTNLYYLGGHNNMYRKRFRLIAYTFELKFPARGHCCPVHASCLSCWRYWNRKRSHSCPLSAAGLLCIDIRVSA